MNAVISRTACAAGLDSVTSEIATAFAGHEVCTSQPYINGVVIHPYQSSFHPSSRGSQAYRDAVATALASIGPTTTCQTQIANPTIVQTNVVEPEPVAEPEPAPVAEPIVQPTADVVSDTTVDPNTAADGSSADPAVPVDGQVDPANAADPAIPSSDPDADPTADQMVNGPRLP
jgi:hypothetical protein